MARILLGVTGSVAAIKTPELVRALTLAGHEVRVVATEPSLYFFDAAALEVPLYRDADEWPGQRYQRDDPVLHIELRRWADLLLVAPLDANTLGKLAYGLADNCLTCVARAWDPARPRLLVPAMNTLMWEHPVTVRQLRALTYDRAPDHLEAQVVLEWIEAFASPLYVLAPISKRLACGDVGLGAMAEVEAIVTQVNRIVAEGNPR
jgi:phosphopantothenoylcysteine decarboxylase